MLGDFLLGYGMLDYLVTLFLKARIPEREFGKLRERGFKDRLDRMAGVIRDAGAPPKKIKWFDGLARRIDVIRDVRNHVAHAHLYGTGDPLTGESAVTLLTAKDADMGLLSESRHVTFKELVETNNDLQALLKDFEALAGFKGEFKCELP
jgi:hypothetical protein